MFFIVAMLPLFGSWRYKLEIWSRDQFIATKRATQPYFSHLKTQRVWWLWFNHRFLLNRGSKSHVRKERICLSIILLENIWHILHVNKEAGVLSAVFKTQSVSVWQRLHQSHYNSSILIQKAARLVDCVLTPVPKQQGSVSPADCPSSVWSVTRVDLSITPPNVSSSSTAVLIVPPRQQPQPRLTDGPLKQQCSWSGWTWSYFCFYFAGAVWCF